SCTRRPSPTRWPRCRPAGWRSSPTTRRSRTSGRSSTVSSEATESAVLIVWLYPDLMSTYGDRGNLLVLAWRARGRGLPVQTHEVRSSQAVPAHADIYLLGGGEDGPQALAARRLAADGTLARAVDTGSVVFGVCAGYQVLGESFYAKGEECAGLGLLDVWSDRGRSEERRVGEGR